MIGGKLVAGHQGGKRRLHDIFDDALPIGRAAFRHTVIIGELSSMFAPRDAGGEISVTIGADQKAPEREKGIAPAALDRRSGA
ncbi:MAG: hypothetical protein AAB645_01015 [Patescibacteria group bacterium]